MNGTTFLHKTYCHELIHFSSHTHGSIEFGTIAMKNMIKYIRKRKHAKISVTLCKKQQCCKNLKIQLIFN